MPQSQRYDAFIAYAAADAVYAQRLRAILVAIGWNVFLDSTELQSGDTWSKETLDAQRRSRLVVVLISRHTDQAYFQLTEILSAIHLARERRTRIVPLYLVGKRAAAGIDTPLQALHAIYWEKDTSLLTIAQRLEGALRTARRQDEWSYHVVPETVIIVTGCDCLPEIFDRPAAYELKDAIENIGRSCTQSFLFSVVMGDCWFVHHHAVQNHGNVLSIGSSGSNGLTGIIESPNRVVHRADDGRWEIYRDRNRWAISGKQAEDTYDAMRVFKEHELPGFLGEIWSQVR